MRGADQLDFEEYMRGRWAALFRTAYLLTGEPVAAEELLQDSLARACASWHKIRDRGAADAYVRRILVNQATRGWKRRGREKATDQLPETGHDGDLGSHEQHLDLWPEIQRLPPRMRAVLVLRYYEDLTEAQTAHELNCSVGTVKSQAHQALRKLRTALGGAETELVHGLAGTKGKA
jgi:RNA polymerase sigma-70 factor (sigma-E family)